MTTRTAIAAGNWSNPAIWDGGASIPGPTDDVEMALGPWEKVTVDQNVTVRSVKNTWSMDIWSGSGYLEVPAGKNVAVTAETFTGVALIYLRSGGTLTLTGTIDPGTESLWGDIVTNDGGTLTYTGDLVGPSGNGFGVPLKLLAGTTVIHGSITGGTGTSAGGLACSIQMDAEVTINGNVTGNVGDAVNGWTSHHLTVNGTVTGGVGDQGTNGAGARMSNTDFTINGPMIAGPAAPAVVHQGTGCLHVTGPAYSVGKVAAFAADKWDIIAGNQLAIATQDTNGHPVTLVSDPFAAEITPGGPTWGDRLLATATIDSTGAQIAAALETP